MLINATRRGLVLGALFVPLAACAEAGPAGHLSELQPVEYRLGAGDKLKITVFGETDLTGEFVVNSQGKVSYPLVGDIQAAGLTAAQFSQNLTQVLSPHYVRNANVSVEITNYRPYFILGEVNSPGTFPFVSGLTVVNAVATAGGFTYRANTRRVYIRHVGEDREAAYVLTGTTLVQPGDTVRIPERHF